MTTKDEKAMTTKSEKAMAAKMEQFRMIRRRGYQKLFSGRDLCIAGFLCMPALLFNPDTGLRILQFLLFWFFAWLAGKRNNPLITAAVILGVAVFHLLVPYGRVLCSLGTFKITAGALQTGIHRGVTLEGLILLSRASVREDLRLPGSFGALIGESFRLFTVITERRHILKGKGIIRGIDELLEELSGPDSGEAPAAAPGQEEGAGPERGGPSPIPGRIILGLAVILAWLPWVCVL
jgi:heptaprenyl diphosphate synthase